MNLKTTSIVFLIFLAGCTGKKATDIDGILASMTLEEKAGLLVGDAWGTRVPGASTFVTEDTFNYESGPVRVPGAPFSTRTMERFGIPGTGMADGTAGVRIDATRPGSDNTYYATCFPSSTAMAPEFLTPKRSPTLPLI